MHKVSAVKSKGSRNERMNLSALSRTSKSVAVAYCASPVTVNFRCHGGDKFMTIKI